MVREWVKQAERDSGARQDSGLASAERQELARYIERDGSCRIPALRHLPAAQDSANLDASDRDATSYGSEG